jgi:hypothetical protein
MFEAKGTDALDVLTGGKECPECHANVNIIIAKRKYEKRR